MGMFDKFGKACELLKGIPIAKDEKEEKEGKVTKSFLRKVYELLYEAEGKEDYILSVGYRVAIRKSRNYYVEFYKRLKNIVNSLSGDWNKVREDLRGMLEQVIKIAYIQAELGEDVCKKP
jgi:hypothetical protein